MSSKKRKLMLEALKASGGNISIACAKAGVSRQSHYNWIDKFDSYKKEVDNIEASNVDLAETMLMKNIREGKETSLIFFLKTKGRDRGYIEKHAVEHSNPDGTMRPIISMTDEQLLEIANGKK